MQQSNTPKLSELVRRLLFNRPLNVYHRDKSLDDFMAEIMHLISELNGVGNNFNQVVKKLHTLRQIEEFKTWILTYEPDKKELINNTEDIKNHINKISEKWLQRYIQAAIFVEF